MNVETFNYSPESLAPFFYLNKRDRKNIYIFPTEKETLEFYNNFSNFACRSDFTGVEISSIDFMFSSTFKPLKIDVSCGK